MAEEKYAVIGRMVRLLRQVESLSQEVDSSKNYAGDNVRNTVFEMKRRVPSFVRGDRYEELKTFAEAILGAIEDLEGTNMGKQHKGKVKTMRNIIRTIINKWLSE